jgi:outer membrane protein TolC
MRVDLRARCAARRATDVRIRGALLALLLIAVGCGSWVAPIREQREAWTRSEALAHSAARKPDPFAGAAVLERGALVQAVLERNPTIAAARHAWRAALERAPQVASFEDPMLGFGVAPRSFGSSEVDDGSRVDISQRVPFPGKLSLRGEVAAFEAEAAAKDFEAVRLRLAATASRLYDDYYLAARSLEVNAQHVALLRELQHIAAARYAVGDGSQQDPIQAEVEHSHALHREILLRTRVRVVAEQILSLLHRPADASLPPPPQALVLPAELPEEPEALAAEALAARPDLAAAQARVRAGEAGVALARREFLPDFTVTGAYDRIWQEEDLQPFVGIGIELPIQIARRRAALAEAQAMLDGTRSEYLAMQDEARFAIRSSALRLAEAQHVRHLFETQQLPAARDQVEAARTGFETGRSEFFAVIDAERSLLRVEIGIEEARADVCRRRAELDRALGRVAGQAW